MFIDLTKAFDTTSRPKLWMILSKYGCPSKLIRVIKDLHENMVGRVAVADGATDHNWS